MLYSRNDDVYMFLIIGIFLFLVLIFCLYMIDIEEKKEKEIISHTDDFKVYQECYELSNKYYCKIEK